MKAFDALGDASTRIVEWHFEPMPAFLTEPRTCILGGPPKSGGRSIRAIEATMADRASGVDLSLWLTVECQSAQGSWHA